jgi:opacity protein-like surface antigen
MNCKRILLAAALLAAPFAAHAESSPLETFAYDPPGGGQGFYAGINGGYGWGNSDQHDTVLPSGPPPPIPEDGGYNLAGGAIGGTLGYYWRFSNWLFGAEGDNAWATSMAPRALAAASTNAARACTRSPRCAAASGRCSAAPCCMPPAARPSAARMPSIPAQRGRAGPSGAPAGRSAGASSSNFPGTGRPSSNISTWISTTTDFVTIPNHTPEEISLTVNVIRVGLNYSF